LDRRVSDGTYSFLRGPAMSREEATAALQGGIELGRDAAMQFDLVGAGEMGVGNSTSASALLCALTGATPGEAAGRGAGLNDDGVNGKREVLAAALALQQIDKSDALCVLAAFGGFEIAIMTGFILGAASKRLPVVMDGFISSSAFLVARAFYRGIGDYVFFGHRSAELAHARPLDEAGAALARGVLTCGVDFFREMATFAPHILSYLNRLSDLSWLFGRRLELAAGVNAALRPADKSGNRWSRPW
jgi:nicotinate-nucleotide--dimethylbenzimidazole phosphoribosyltransferase